MKNNVLLEVENITKVFTLSNGSKFQSLNGVSFTLNKGESIGIIGANGSGKSTLLKIISGIIKPTTGVVKLYGSVASILDLGFGMIPELTGRENIYLSAKLDGLTNTYIENKIEDIIDFAEIGQYIDEPVKNYSNGMFLRLAFAIKTVIVPDILILDEVVAVGDARFQSKAKEQIQNIKNNGCSLVLVSHNLQQIELNCSHALVLEHGSVKGYEKAKKIIDKYYQAQFDAEAIISHDETDKLCSSYLDLYSASITNQNQQITNSSPITIEIEFNKKIPDGIDINLQLSDTNGVFLADSNLFRESADRLTSVIGRCIVKITIPPFLLNSGTFYGHLFFGEEQTIYLKKMHAFHFTVKPDRWEKDKFWNDGWNSFPTRPKLEWKVESII